MDCCTCLKSTKKNGMGNNPHTSIVYTKLHLPHIPKNKKPREEAPLAYIPSNKTLCKCLPLPA
jgi:hypothetical protein